MDAVSGRSIGEDMKIEDYIIEEYVAGWVLKCPYEGIHKKTKQPETKWKNSYHSTLEQCLKYVRDHMAKECEAVNELITLLNTASHIDTVILFTNGLINKKAA